MSEEKHAVEKVLADAGVEVPGAGTTRFRVVGDPPALPRLQLPGGGRSVSTFGRELGAILRENAVLFVRDGEIVFVDHDARALVPMRPRCFRTWCENFVITYSTSYSRAAGMLDEVETMGLETAATLLDSEGFKESLPKIERLHDQRLPVLRPDGSVERLEPGLDELSKVYTMPDSLDYRLDLEIDAARTIWRDVHREFPLGDWKGTPMAGTSRSLAVHTVAALSQFAWMMVPEFAQRLSFIYFSNSQRSGKSLMAKIPLALVYGRPATSSYKKDEEKMALTLDVIARNRSPYALFDNLRGHIASEELEAFLTSEARKVRMFHTQQERVFPNRASCFLTGNAITWSSDVAGRCLVVDLFVEEADAQDRQVEIVRNPASFLEPGLRADLLSALWAFVREWAAKGRPRPSRRLKGFESWCDMIGGMATQAALGDPFEPRPQDLAGGDTDMADMVALVERLATGILTVAEFRFEAVVQAALDVNAFEWVMKGRERLNDDGTKSFVMDHSERRKFSNLLADTYGGRTFKLPDGRRVTWSHRGKNRGRHYTISVTHPQAAES